MDPPVGAIAMLFTDIEGSTALATRLGRDWPGVLAEHHQVVGGAIAAEGGYVNGTEGDAFFATFADPAVAVAAQRALHGHELLRVRMGLHVGFVERNDTGYVGLEVHRAARVAGAAHGGQLLMTAAAREVIGDAVPVELVGAHRLKDFPSPVQLYCAVIDGRGVSSFPPPRTQEARPTNLPAGEPALVGRDADLERIEAALLRDGERLVTLTGRGGAGKTSLALVAGARLLDAHPAGVWWVNLSTVSSPDAVEETIAATVGAERNLQASAAEALTGHLRDRGAVLLILDTWSICWRPRMRCARCSTDCRISGCS